MRAFALACLFAIIPLTLGAQSAQTPAAPADAASTGASPAQPPAAGQPTFRTGVGVVRVDVTVTGRDDRAVPDLALEDFEVREDGVLQDVQSAQLVRVLPSEDEPAPIRDAEHAAREAAREDVRLLVIFLDDYHLRFGPLHDIRLKSLLRGFIEAEMRPTDLFAVMEPLTPLSDLGLTRDKQAILDRIARLQGRLGGFVPPRSVIEENQVFAGRDLPRVRAEVSLSALQALVSYLGGLRDGRASVLFVSEGPPLVTGFGSTLSDRLRDVVTAANTSNVTVHTLDPRELGASRYTSGVNEALAADTGGRRLAHSNDYSKGLRAVLADAGAYYLLGYEPPREPADGRFHKIEVKVRRKGLRVIARKGYWAPKPQELTAARTAVPESPPAIAAALREVGDSARPHLCQDWVGVGPVQAGQAPVTVHCTPTSRGADERRPAALEVRVLGADGKPVATHRAEPDGERRWAARFTAPPGPLALRVVATDADGGEIDGWTRELTVPPASDPAARFGTPLVFHATTPAAFRAVSASSAETLSTTARAFRRTDRVLVRWPGVADATTAAVRAELVNGRGQTLVALPVVRPSPDAAQVELPLANLAQAEYVLRLTARLDGRDHSALVGFQVIP